LLLWLLLSTSSALAGNDSVSRAELESRAHIAERQLLELQNQIRANQEAAERNQQAIHDVHAEVAHLKGTLAAWGAMIGILSGSGLVVTLIKHRPKPPPN
jgi:4-diphosphocytidyl-2C-methyl-D-erythritol kinase